MGSSFVLADSEAATSLRGIGLRVLVVNASLHDQSFFDCPLASGVTPTSPAFIVFSGGSTGKPKGIVLKHVGISSVVSAEMAKFNIDDTTNRFQFAGYTFDVSVTDVVSTLSASGCVCIPSEHERMYDIAGAINCHGANVANLTPTIVKILTPEGVPGVKILIIGG